LTAAQARAKGDKALASRLITGCVTEIGKMEGEGLTIALVEKLTSFGALCFEPRLRRPSK
jgi:hypothetical protein